jgi:hypothetical protein
MTIYQDQAVDIESTRPLLKSLIKDQLKTTFVLIKSIAFEGINEQTSETLK